jgi:hypothetical protein
MRRAARLKYYREKDRTYCCQACQSLSRVPTLATGLLRETIRRLKNHDSSVNHQGLAELAAKTLADHGLELTAEDISYFLEREDEVLTPKEATQFMALYGRENPPPEVTSEAALLGVEGKAARQNARDRNGILGGENHIARLERVTAGKWRVRANRLVRQCQVCGKLVFAAPSLKYDGPQMHQDCMVQGMRTPETRRWLSVRTKRRVAGESAWAINRATGSSMPIRTISLRADEEHLTRDFRWAVLHYLGGTSLAALASEAGTDRSTVQRAVKGIVSKLPEPEVVPKRDKPVVERLRSHLGNSRFSVGV